MEQTETKHNPDVLECLANLSNDEVFTPPRVANAMLDLLPQELFRNPKTTFLDPCCKSGVFLREIAKRLIVGLEPVFPDLQERLDHIFHKQLFGFAITELTALTSRRTVYCTKSADGEYAISHFDTSEGNILLPHAKHEWVDGKCRLCGASKETLKDRTESHAYAFIHGINPEKVFHMKFDVIIGNPPYQLTTSNTSAQATPLYNRFIEQAIQVKPRHLCMIVPARWFSGGMGLDAFRSNMIRDKRMEVLHDFLDSEECFSGVEIKGGVCYFLWSQNHNGQCKIYTHERGKDTRESLRFMKEDGLEIFIRHQVGVDIYHKVHAHNEKSFADLVSSQRPFGIGTAFRGEAQPMKGGAKIYQKGGIGFIHYSDIPKGDELIGKWKLYISRVYGAGESYPHQILGIPLLGQPNSVCTETYLMLGPFDTEQQAMNAKSYVATRFFRFLVYLTKISQDALRKVYELVPMQDFSKPWTDEELYAKYGLTDEEIAFIESMVKPMEV